jgi:hypothetical protein
LDFSVRMENDKFLSIVDIFDTAPFREMLLDNMSKDTDFCALYCSKWWAMQNLNFALADCWTKEGRKAADLEIAFGFMFLKAMEGW